MHALLLAAALAAAAPAPRSAPPHPALARALSGRVTDTTGSPLAQVRVTVLEVNRTTTTDLDGTVPSSRRFPRGTYGVSFALVGYAPQVKRVVIREADVTLDATLEPTLIELPDLQVTATPLATTSLTSPQPVSVMSGDQVQEHRAASLGETISQLPRRAQLQHGIRHREAGHPRSLLDQGAGPGERAAGGVPAVGR